MFELRYYQLKIDCYKYVLSKPHGNHKAKTYTQTIERKKSKHYTTDNHQITKEESKKKKGTEELQNSQQTIF